MTTTKKCKWCDQPFEPYKNGAGKHYCSPAHRELRNKEERRLYAARRRAAAKKSAPAPVFTHTCAHCKKEFTTAENRGRHSPGRKHYCSVAHRKAAAVLRKKQCRARRKKTTTT